MASISQVNSFNRPRLDDRQVAELIGMSRGMLADGNLNDEEIVYLYKWLAASGGATENPLLRMLFDRIDEVLRDNVVSAEERQDLISTLSSFVGNDFEVGEALKATSLPLCRPAPSLVFTAKVYVFTGTFTFGSRAQCIAAIEALGARSGNLTKQTDVLVIGEYATDSWRQSSYGTKIEKAASMREAGHPIAIVSERHWRGHLTAA